MRLYPDPIVMVQQRLNFFRYVKDDFGTGNAFIVADGTLQVVDMKYGTGIPISAEGNIQMRLHTLSALNRLGELYDIESIIRELNELPDSIHGFDPIAFRVLVERVTVYSGKRVIVRFRDGDSVLIFPYREGALRLERPSLSRGELPRHGWARVLRPALRAAQEMTSTVIHSSCGIRSGKSVSFLQITMPGE